MENNKNSIILYPIMEKSKYRLTIITEPYAEDDDIEVFNSIFYGKGHEFELEEGIYNFTITKENFQAIESSVTIYNEDVELRLSLLRERYRLNINVDTNKVKITVFNIYNEIMGYGKLYYLPNGSYKILVEKPGYHDMEYNVVIDNDDVNLDIYMDEIEYNLKFEYTPDTEFPDLVPGTALYINDQWVRGKTFFLNNGVYNYKYFKHGFYPIYGKAEINGSDVTVTEGPLKRKMFKLNIITDPEDAKVNIQDDKGNWVVTKSITLPEGLYEYQVTKNLYYPHIGYSLLDKTNEDVKIKLKREFYVITFITSPSNAKVEINGEVKNTFLLREGEYDAKISYPAYKPLVKTILVNSDETITVVLEHLLFNIIFNVLPYNTKCELKVNGEWKEGEKHQDLIVGVYEYRISKEGYETVTGKVNLIDKDEVITLILKEAISENPITDDNPNGYGRLFVVSKVGDILCEVQIDGIWTEFDETKGIPLAPGRYSLRCEKEGFETWKREIFMDTNDQTVNPHFLDKFVPWFRIIFRMHGKLRGQDTITVRVSQTDEKDSNFTFTSLDSKDQIFYTRNYNKNVLITTRNNYSVETETRRIIESHLVKPNNVVYHDLGTLYNTDKSYQLILYVYSVSKKLVNDRVTIKMYNAKTGELYRQINGFYFNKYHEYPNHPDTKHFVIYIPDDKMEFKFECEPDYRYNKTYIGDNTTVYYKPKASESGLSKRSFDIYLNGKNSEPEKPKEETPSAGGEIKLTVKTHPENVASNYTISLSISSGGLYNTHERPLPITLAIEAGQLYYYKIKKKSTSKVIETGEIRLYNNHTKIVKIDDDTSPDPRILFTISPRSLEDKTVIKITHSQGLLHKTVKHNKNVVVKSGEKYHYEIVNTDNGKVIKSGNFRIYKDEVINTVISETPVPQDPPIYYPPQSRNFNLNIKLIHPSQSSFIAKNFVIVLYDKDKQKYIFNEVKYVSGSNYLVENINGDISTLEVSCKDNVYKGNNTLRRYNKQSTQETLSIYLQYIPNNTPAPKTTAILIVKTNPEYLSSHYVILLVPASQNVNTAYPRPLPATISLDIGSPYSYIIKKKDGSKTIENGEMKLYNDHTKIVNVDGGSPYQPPQTSNTKLLINIKDKDTGRYCNNESTVVLYKYPRRSVGGEIYPEREDNYYRSFAFKNLNQDQKYIAIVTLKKYNIRTNERNPYEIYIRYESNVYKEIEI